MRASGLTRLAVVLLLGDHHHPAVRDGQMATLAAPPPSDTSLAMAGEPISAERPIRGWSRGLPG